MSKREATGLAMILMPMLTVLCWLAWVTPGSGFALAVILWFGTGMWLAVSGGPRSRR